MFKKLFSFLIILSMTLVFFTGVPISVSAAEEIVDSGDCGDSVTYTLTKNGGTVTVNGEEKDAYTLTISGTGGMNDYTSSTNPPPWYDIKDTITSVVIGNGVTLIGRSSFYQCGNLASVTIPDSVTSIGDHAFNHCKSLTSVTIPDSVTSIDVFTLRT